jgi:hypothetical protein
MAPDPGAPLLIQTCVAEAACYHPVNAMPASGVALL